MKFLKQLSYVILLVLCPMLGSTYLNAETIMHQLTANRYTIVKIHGTNDASIKMEDYALVSSPGKPILPYKIIQIPLPENTDLHSLKLKIENIEEETIRGQYNIEPAKQGISPKKDDINGLKYNQKDFLFIDNTIYKKDSFFPAEPIKLLSPSTKGIKKGNIMNFVRILYSPIQYNPVTKKLKIIKKAKISIIYKTIDRSHIIPVPGTELQLKSNYVIITTNKIKNNSNELQRFIDFKKRQGYSVRIITENNFNRVTTAPYPNRRAEKIREWLRKNYQLFGIEYVLLIGNPEPDDPMYSHDIGDELNDPHYINDNYIPMKQIWNSLPGRGSKTGNCQHNPPLTNDCQNTFVTNAPYPYGGVATDWYYADLTGNWDSDGDGFYGETPMAPQNVIEITPLPCGLGSEDHFSSRWDKTIDLNSSQDVTFELRQWPAARLFIDGNMVFDHWPQTKRNSETHRTIHLSSGRHKIVIEYFKKSDHGHIFVRMNEKIMNGFEGKYFDNPYFQGNACSHKTNESLWKNWESSDFATSGGVDLDAEVSVGRIPVYENNYSTLDRILAKLVIDEGGRLVQNKILLPMVPMDNNNTTPAYDIGEAILNDIATPSNFSTYRIYDNNYSLLEYPDITPCNPNNVVDAWNNNNFDMATWMSHGVWRYANYILDVKFQIQDLNKTIPIIFAASCSVGNIYIPDYYPCCPSDLNNIDRSDGRISLGYTLLKEGKANAVVSASEWSSYYAGGFNQNDNNRDNANFAYLYTKEIISNRSTVGDALRNIKYTPFGAPVDEGLVYRQELIYNLFGDPSYLLKNNRLRIEPIEPPERRIP